jgi:hypothetical protein
MITVLVPVLRRPNRVKPLIESFLANSTGDTDLFFIVQDGDTEEYEAIEYETKLSERLNFFQVEKCVTRWSEKLNAAHRRLLYDHRTIPSLTMPSWYLLGADDLHFHKGWDDNPQLKTLMDVPQIGVIGTNDLGNPAVKAGKHSTHPLVRIEYVERHGIQEARQLIAPEIYHHCFVDNEIVATARHRNAYAHCHESIVEHLHPAWRKAEKDDTYALGSNPEKFVSDRKMFEARQALYGWPKWNE